MGLYIYQNPNTEEIKEIFQNMNDEHSYEENGIKWARLWTIPRASIDSNLNPDSSKDFMRYTSTRAGKFSDLQDLSAELSEKRKDRHGVDSVKEKFYDNYAKERGGRRHIKEKKEKLKDSLNNNPNSPFTIDI